MASKLERFQIRGLHGYKNYDIPFQDNKLVLVGENGTGKTTVLRLLYYLLSGQLDLLTQYKFAELSVTINGKTHVLKSKPVEEYGNINIPHILQRLPPIIRSQLFRMHHRDEQITFHEISYICEKYDFPIQNILHSEEFHLLSRLHNKSAKKELESVLKNISDSFDSQILYLPTYRRIEQELRLIFKGGEEDMYRADRKQRIQRGKNKTYVELIEFGMKDVENLITCSLEGLKEFARENLNTLTLGYLGDVVDQKYSQVNVKEIQSASDETIRGVLDRIQENILSEQHKAHLLERINSVRKSGNPDEHAKVICHYFLKLLNFQSDLQNREVPITSFCRVCNDYLETKEFVYDSAKFEYSIKVTNDKASTPASVELQQLSSGEKQIVSLFSHLYLSGDVKYFVLIDEPELSLSVPWQRKFLVNIVNGSFCDGLIAVTHSPFIYDNDLKNHTHGLGEFEI